MSNSESYQSGPGDVELSKRLHFAVASFLGREPEEVSQDFIQKFDKIRNDVLLALPEQVKKYAIAKKRFEQENKGRTYTDPRVENIDVNTRRVLLSYASALGIEQGTPGDIVIRAVSSIKKTAILTLEGKNPASITGISQEQKDAEKGAQKAAKVYNFFRKRTTYR